MFAPNVKSKRKRKSIPIQSDVEDNVDTKKSKSSDMPADEIIDGKVNLPDDLGIEEVNPSQNESTNRDEDKNSTPPRTLKDIIKQKPSGRPTKAHIEKTAERKKKREEKNKNDNSKSIKEETEVQPKTAPEPPTETIPTPSSQPSGQSYAPQLRIVDGKIEIDKSSLIIAQVTEEVHRDVVHENRTHITSGTYLKKSPSERWTNEEIETFYKAIRQCGTDFSLVERFFPNRTRRQIKNRYKKEEKTNPSKIDDALRNRMPLDVEFLKSTMTKK